MSRSLVSPYRQNGQPALDVLFYAERWNLHEREAVGLLDEAKARKLHERGKLYTVVLGDRESKRPHVFIEVRLKADFVGVTSLDAQLRDWIVQVEKEDFVKGEVESYKVKDDVRQLGARPGLRRLRLDRPLRAAVASSPRGHPRRPGRDVRADVLNSQDAAHDREEARRQCGK